MQAAQRQGTVSQEIARQADGVLLAVGALSSVLKKKVGSQAITNHAHLWIISCFAPSAMLPLWFAADGYKCHAVCGATAQGQVVGPVLSCNAVAMDVCRGMHCGAS